MEQINNKHSPIEHMLEFEQIYKLGNLLEASQAAKGIPNSTILWAEFVHICVLVSPHERPGQYYFKIFISIYNFLIKFCILFYYN